MNETIFKVEGNVLTMTRTFDANRDLVWRAWTEAELLDQWWAPKPWKSQTKSMEFNEKGFRLYAMVGPEGEMHWGRTNYGTITQLNSFSGEDVFCDENGTVNTQLPVAKFKNVFTGDSNQTMVVITTEYASEQHLKQVLEMGMKEGFTMALQNLDEVLNEMSVI